MHTDIYKTTMRNGLYMGVLFSVNFLLSSSRNLVLILLSYLVIAMIIGTTYRLAIQFRDRDSGGFISFGKVLSFVLLTFFFGGIISALFKILYTSFINTEFLPQLYEEGLRQLENNRALLERFITMDEAYYDQVERQFRPANYAFQAIWANLLSGLILGLLLGGIIRKKRGLFDEDNQQLPGAEN